MKFKNVIILAVIFFCLSLTAYFYHYLSNKPRETKDFAHLDKGEISKIEVVKNDQVSTFENKEGLWQITKPFDYRADQSLVDDLISKVKDLSLDTVISTNPEKHDKFQVDKKEGSQMNLYNNDGKKVVSFIIGKMGTDYLHSYLRFPDKDEVYLSKGISKYFIDRDIKEWRDKTILSLNKDDLKEINLIYPTSVSGKHKRKQEEEIVKLLRKEDKWLLGDKEVDSRIWDMFLNSLIRFNMDDLVDKPEEAKNEAKLGLKSPSFQIIVKLKNNQEEKIFVGNENDKKQYYVKREGVETIFLVNSSRVDNMKKKPSDLIKKEEKTSK